MRVLVAITSALAFSALACSSTPPKKKEPLGQLPSAVTTAVPLWIPFSIAAGTAQPGDARETRLASLRQLTTDGSSYGAVWAPDGQSIFFTKRTADGCGRAHHMDLVSGETVPIATTGWADSLGATEEQLFFVHGDKPEECPQGPAATQRRLGAASLFMGKRDSSTAELIPGALALDVSRDGAHLVFSSMRDGDPELYRASSTGQTITRVTHAAGYDGAPAFSPDGSKIVWEAERIGEGEEEKEAYATQLGKRSVAPKRLTIMLARNTGEPARVIAKAGTFNTSPSFMPDSQRVLYASNVGDASNFDVYLVDPDGPATATGEPRVHRVTYSDGYDGQARMSPDGKYVLFTSSRAAAGSTNVFVARWLGE